MRNVVSIVALVALTGCGSTWTVGKDYVIVGPGDLTALYYPDSDDDGWGDPSADSELLNAPDPDRGLTATNGRDCDDGDPEVTGRVGAVCPDGLIVSATPIQYVGVIEGEDEYLAVHGDSTPTQRFSQAEVVCTQGWAQSEQREDGTWATTGGLATFGTPAALQALLDGLETALDGAGTTNWAGFVGIGWEGSFGTGNWSWVDDSDDSVFLNQLGWCTGEPQPGEFFPNLDPGDPTHLAAIEAQVGAVRVALVRQSGNWCLDTPDVVPGMTESEAHFVCERPAPDPENYIERPPAEEPAGE